MRRSALGLALAALTLPVLAACGSSGGTDAGGIPENSPTAVTSESAAPTDTAEATVVKCVKKGAKVPSASTTFGETPDISKPTGAPPCELVVKDLKVGSGKAVTDISKNYDWNYEGVSWSTGEKFDSSFDRGAPTPFALNQVIPGWTEGLKGMKPGGRRILVIPSDKAYGETGNTGIAPNETLVFVVDLVGPANA